MATLAAPRASEHAGRHWHYLVYGIKLCSNIPIPDLPIADFQIRDVLFRYSSNSALGNGRDHQSWEVLTRKSTNLGCDLLVLEGKESFLLRWEGTGDFEVSKDGRRIDCNATSGPAYNWTSATLCGMVLAFALHLRGSGCLHASAVALPQGAIGFLAGSGTGKSTLSAAFSAQGYPFLTDDVLVFQDGPAGYLANPGFPCIALSRIAATEFIRANGSNGHEVGSRSLNGGKHRINVDGEWASFRRELLPLRGLFILNRAEDAAEVIIESLSRKESIQELLENTNCLSLLPPSALKTQVDAVARLTASVPVWRLNYPSGFQHTPAVIREVLGLMSKTVELKEYE